MVRCSLLYSRLCFEHNGALDASVFVRGVSNGILMAGQCWEADKRHVEDKQPG